MAFTWVRPSDPTVLAERPLLDLGTGDGQTLAALAPGRGLRVGVDRSLALLRPGNVNAEAHALPFRDGSFGVVLAGDLFHHLDDDQLRATLAESMRVLRPTGRLVAWWYESAGLPASDSPGHPRSFDAVASFLGAFADVEQLSLVMTLEPSPPTVGVTCVASERAE
jgi:SAM-dependent methyltransferase